MTLRAVLFDLDNTLLENPMSRFLPRYFGALQAFTRTRLAHSDRLLPALLAATRRVVETAHPDQTNEQIVLAHLEQALESDRATLAPVFAAFYRDVYPTLAQVTRAQPLAPRWIQAAFTRFEYVVIATNPLFPRVAIEQRLQWAGVPVSDWPYALVTTYENMRSAKPAAAYYDEIAVALGVAAADCLMVGDDWENDIAPAAALGMQTFWLTDGAALPPTAVPVTSRGASADLLHWIEAQPAL